VEIFYLPCCKKSYTVFLTESRRNPSCNGPPWLTLLKGSATNVVGLPMELLDDMLRSF
jgi:hypothetical protein